MNGNLNIKTINDFEHDHLLSIVDHCPFQTESFLTKGTSNLLLVTYQYLFMTFIWWKGRPWITLLNNELRFDVNQNLIARTLKDQFSPSSVCFPLSTSSKQEISYFHKNICKCICCFCRVCFIQLWLIGQILKVNQFNWPAWVSHIIL